MLLRSLANFFYTIIYDSNTVSFFPYQISRHQPMIQFILIYRLGFRYADSEMCAFLLASLKAQLPPAIHPTRDTS